MATLLFVDSIKRLLFQSTPPIRVATSPRLQSGCLPVISIHATHTGGDICSNNARFCCQDFNPRHPYGWRLRRHGTFDSLQGISIHATHTGGDGNIADWFSEETGFQSTPPIRVATGLQDLLGPLIKNFNPRHPYGWRPVAASRFFGATTFQSTPPIRVATDWMVI